MPKIRAIFLINLEFIYKINVYMWYQLVFMPSFIQLNWEKKDTIVNYARGQLFVGLEGLTWPDIKHSNPNLIINNKS